uniref:HTH CENPB-type domain-containing protein n=1 Tax=Clastoptera arizonana TaxID=38151 RepID=A0A1B6DA07_9HEMI
MFLFVSSGHSEVIGSPLIVVMEKQKRKKIVLSMQDKLKALKRLDKGETMQKVTDDYGVGRRTVGDWRKIQSELEKWCSSRVTETNLKDRKTIKKRDYEKTSEALYIWFVQFRDKGVPISGLILKGNALHFQTEFQEGEADFTASTSWQDRWKKRYVSCLFAVRNWLQTLKKWLHSRKNFNLLLRLKN